jgi:hypothetical protein
MSGRDRDAGLAHQALRLDPAYDGAMERQSLEYKIVMDDDPHSEVLGRLANIAGPAPCPSNVALTRRTEPARIYFGLANRW